MWQTELRLARFLHTRTNSWLDGYYLVHRPQQQRAHPDAPGARRYFRRYRLGLTKAPKQSHSPCTHALGALCVAIFERKPYAQVETFHPAFLGGVLFRDAREFL